MSIRLDIEVYADGGGGVFVPLLGLQRASYAEELEYLPAANPTQYGAEYGIGGMLSWRLQSQSVSIVTDLTADMMAVQKDLLSQMAARQTREMAIRFSAGDWRVGPCLIRAFDFGFQLGQPVAERIDLLGQGAPSTVAPTLAP